MADWGRRLFAACDIGDLKRVESLLKHKEAKSFVNEKYEDDETPLFRATKEGYLEIVHTLVQYKADVDSINSSEGRTPLIVATENDERQIVKYLVEHNADVNIQKLSGPERGWSALMCASKVKSIWLVIPKLLLEHGAVIDLEGDIDQKTLTLISKCYGVENECKWTALMIACRYGNEETVKLLIKHGANVNKQNNEGLSPLMFAVLNPNIYYIYMDESDHKHWQVEDRVHGIPELLLKVGTYVDLRTLRGGLSALMIASKNGNTEAVKLLLKHGAMVNAQSINGWSALKFAKENGHEETAQLLKEHGGKIIDKQPDDETKKWLDLVIACENGLTRKAEYLSKQIVDINMINEWSVLMIASRKDDAKMAKVLLEHGANANLRNENGWSALMFASQKGWTETIKVLIEHGANNGINELCSENALNALIIAAQNGHTETVQYLLEKGARVNLQNSKGMSALMVAAERGHTETTKLLLEQRADVNLQDNIGKSALFFAVENGHTETTKLLLKQGADTNLLNKDGKTPLFISVKTVFDTRLYTEMNLLLNLGDDTVNVKNYDTSLRMIRLLLDHGADVNTRDSNTWSPLMYASHKGYFEVAELLIEYKAHVNMRSKDGWSALMLASKNYQHKVTQKHLISDHKHTIELLMKHGAKVNMQNNEGMPALMLAVKSNIYAVVELMKYDVYTGLRTYIDGLSALMIASKNGNTEVVKLLLKHGARVNAQSSNGWSALMFAKENGHKETAQVLEECEGKTYKEPDDETKKWLDLVIVCENGLTRETEYLLKQGINVNKVNEDDGISALMTVCQNGNTELAKLLLKHGADPNLVNRNGWSALTFASQKGRSETIKLLLEYGASLCDSEIAPIVAAQNGHTETVQYLLEEGARVNLQNGKGMSALMAAAESGHTETAELLLERGASINLQDNNGKSALFISVENGHTKTTKLLLDNGADVNMNDRDAWSPLMYASHKGHSEVAELLIEYNAYVNMQSKDGWSALMLAVMSYRTIHLLQILLDHGAYTHLRTVKDGLSALMIASKNGNTQAVKCLLKYGANMNVLSSSGWSALTFAKENKHEKTLQVLEEHGGIMYKPQADHEINKWLDLVIACENGLSIETKYLLKQGVDINMIANELSVLMIVSKSGNTVIAELLLEHGANVNLENKHGWSALMFASQSKQTKTAKLLLDYGADVNVQSDDGTSVLMVSRFTELTEVLLDHGANVDIRNNDGASALMVSIQNGDGEVFELLLEYGADIHIQNHKGESAIMTAVEKGENYIQIVERLLDYGARINIQNIYGMSNLMIAIQNGFMKTAQLLLDHGAHVNVQDNEGMSALMVAVKNENVEAVILLLDYSADINMQNKNTWSALMFACQRGHFEITKLLLEYGANVNLQKSNGWTALMLMLASTNANFETANLMLNYGADINIKGNDGWSALMLARNHYARIATLFETISVSNLIDRAKTIVEVTSSEQYFSWHDYGLHLYIPEKSLPDDIQQCIVHIEASITGDYQLPQDIHLVSAVYSFKCVPKIQFSKPLTLEIQHCAKQENIHKLCFIMSKSRANPSFHVIGLDDHSQFEIVFPKHTKHGIIELDKFCDYGIAVLNPESSKLDQGRSDEVVDYCVNVYRQHHEGDPKCHRIFFAILWDTGAHNKVSDETYYVYSMHVYIMYFYCADCM